MIAFALTVTDIFLTSLEKRKKLVMSIFYSQIFLLFRFQQNKCEPNFNLYRRNKTPWQYHPSAHHQHITAEFFENDKKNPSSSMLYNGRRNTVSGENDGTNE